MKSHLRKRRSRQRGAALAVAMLVVVMLSAVGIVALNAASYDVATTAAMRQAAQVHAVADTGLSVARCEYCKNLDAAAVEMQKVRVNQGRSAEFLMTSTNMAAFLKTGATYYEPAAAGRGSFGLINASPQTEFWVRIDRPVYMPTESVGYQLRESGASDTGETCFYRYRFTADGQFAGPGLVAPAAYVGGATAPQVGNREYQANHRAYILTGPALCQLGS